MAIMGITEPVSYLRTSAVPLGYNLEFSMQDGQDTGNTENTLAPKSNAEQSLTGPTPTPEADQGTPTPQEGAAETASTGEEQTAGSEKKAPTAPWFQRRIDQLTAEKWEERREKDAIKAQAAALLQQLAEMRSGSPSKDTIAQTVAEPGLQQPKPEATRSNAPVSEAEIEARATAKAEQIAATQTFNKACNKIADDGKDAYADFDTAVKTFGYLGGIPTQLLNTLVELPDAHKILYAIGKDPELAERIVKMSPTRMAVELARVESTLSKPTVREVSQAPKPITPLNESARAQEDPERMSTSEWLAWREKTKKTRF